MVRRVNVAFGVIGGKEEEEEDSNVHFAQKRNNSSADFNIFSTHLSGDEV